MDKGVIKGFHHASVLVKDTDRALQFYVGVLGLECNHHRPALSYPGAWLDLGDGGQIHSQPRRKAIDHDAQCRTVGFAEGGDP